MKEALQNYGSPLAAFDDFFKLHVVCPLCLHHTHRLKSFALFQVLREGALMPEALYQQFIQLLICCNYYKQEATAIVAPPSPDVHEEFEPCGLASSPGFWESLSRSSSLTSNKSIDSSKASASSKISSKASTVLSAGGGSADDDVAEEGYGLTNKELTSQKALSECFAEVAEEKKQKSSKKEAKAAQKSKAAAKALRIKGNNPLTLTFFFNGFNIVVAALEGGENSDSSDSEAASEDKGSVLFISYCVIILTVSCRLRYTNESRCCETGGKINQATCRR